MVKTPVLVLLAGGKSDRMGFPKGLLNFNGRYWILEQISRFKDVLDPKVYIGLGFEHELYGEHIPWLKEALTAPYIFDGVEVRVVINRHPELGAFSTLQTILNEIKSEVPVLVQPIDVPILNSRELQKLISVKNEVVTPSYKSKNGHPVKLSSEFWSPLLEIDRGDPKARLDVQIKQVSTKMISSCSVSDDAVIENLNNEVVWQNYLQKKSSAD